MPTSLPPSTLNRPSRRKLVKADQPLAIFRIFKIGYLCGWSTIEKGKKVGVVGGVGSSARVVSAILEVLGG